MSEPVEVVITKANAEAVTYQIRNAGWPIEHRGYRHRRWWRPFARTVEQAAADAWEQAIELEVIRQRREAEEKEARALAKGALDEAAQSALAAWREQP